MRFKVWSAVVCAGLLLPAAPAVAQTGVDAAQGVVSADVQSAGKTRYYKSGWYPGYVAVRLFSGGSKVRAVFQGDGPGWCFVGRRVSSGVYRGSDYTFGVGKRRATYRRSDILSGRRVSPPGWFKKSSKVAFARPQCS